MSNWQSAPLSKLAEIRISNVDKKSKPGERPVRLCNYMDVYSNDYITGDIEFMESTANIIEKEKFRVEEGDVLITKDSETPYDIGIPSVVISDIEDLVCGYHLALIKPDKNVIHPIFLSKQLGSAEVASCFSRMAAGSTRYGLSNGAIARTRISFPLLADQRKISVILKTIDQAIEKTEALIEKYQQIKAGLMHDLFTRGIGADGKLRPHREQAPELYQDTPIGWIPKGWSVGSLTFYLDPSSGLKPGPFGSSVKKDSYTLTGFKIYGQEQVISGDQWFGDYYIDHAKYMTLVDFSVAEADILVSLVGTIGKVLEIRVPFEPGIINPRLMRFRPNTKTTNVEFLKHLLTSNIVSRQLEQYAGGGTMPVLNAGTIRKVKVLIIKDKVEQTSIAEKLDKCESRIEKESALLTKLKNQKSGLMHDLLTGKVEVKIDQPEVASF